MKDVEISGAGSIQTDYVHDATGNILATYQLVNNDTLNLDELMMYGSSRLGTIGLNTYLTDTHARDSARLTEDSASINDYTQNVTSYPGMVNLF